MPVRHFLRLDDLSEAELRQLLDRSIALKASFGNGKPDRFMHGKTATLIFEKSSTRTRVSFEACIAQSGGSSIFLGPAESHLSRGESIEDTARVLSRMVDLIIMRTGPHERLERMAEIASIPVINGLSDFNHPCQVLADLQTFIEHRGDVSGRKVAWIGDGNNVCHSWMNAARLLGFDLCIATPKQHTPNHEMITRCRHHVTLTRDPAEAASGADLVLTDTWSSMGHEREAEIRKETFRNYCVDERIMGAAVGHALFMHCLPAYRGYEVAAEVIDGPQSVVWDEAENRLHAQKALIEFLLSVN